MRKMSAFISIFFAFLPGIAFASGENNYFDFLWSSPVWSMSAMTLILLWIALLILSGNSTHSRRAKGSGQKPITSMAETSASDVQPEMVYVVKRGDSLASIARQHHTTREQVIALNGMQAPFKMKLGQTIRIPKQPALSAVPARLSVDNIKKSSASEISLPWKKEDGIIPQSTFRKPPGSALALWLKSLIALVTLSVVLLFIVLLWVQKFSQPLSWEKAALPIGTLPVETPASPEVSEPTALVPTTTATSSNEYQPDDVTSPVIILNGSGVRGAAGKLKELMEAEDFLVAETGNANRFDYVATEVRYAPRYSVWAEVIAGWLRLKGYQPTLLEQKDATAVTIVVGRQ